MMRSLAPGVTLLLLLAWTSPSEAQIYRWTDERGVTNYTEGLDSVPEKHRATAVAAGPRNAAPTPPAGGPGGPAPPAKGRGGPGGTRAPGRETVTQARVRPGA